jgi:hypothetical protein
MIQRCHRTSRLLDAALAGGSLATDARAHVAECAACRSALSAVDRFDVRLHAAASALAAEPMPPAGAVLRTPAAATRRSSVLPVLAGFGAVVAVVVIAVLLGSRLAGVLPPSVGSSGRSTPTASASPDPLSQVPEEMREWAGFAPRTILTHLDRPLAAAGPLARLERCPGNQAIGFWTNPGDDGYPYIYGAGPYLAPASEQAVGGGMASSLDEPEAAYARAQQPKPCEVVFDSAPGQGAVLDAYRRTDPHATDMVVLAVTSAGPDVAVAYLDELRPDGRHQSVLVLRREGGQWRVTGSQGGEFPAGGAPISVTAMGTAKGLPDDRWAAAGRTNDASVVAVEIDFEGFAHRYPVTGDHAFVVQLPPNAGFGLPYRLLDADGNVVSEGLSSP